MRILVMGLALAAATTMGAQAYADGIPPDPSSSNVHSWRDPCWPLNHPAARGIDCGAQGYKATYPALNREPLRYAGGLIDDITGQFGSIFDGDDAYDVRPDSYDGLGSGSEDFTYFRGSGGYGVSQPSIREGRPVQRANIWVEGKDQARARIYSR